jgi:hypothetical protein
MVEITKKQQCHISRIFEISLWRCRISCAGCAYLKEIIHLQWSKIASPGCWCRVSRRRCGISIGDLQISGYVTLLVLKLPDDDL